MLNSLQQFLYDKKGTAQASIAAAAPVDSTSSSTINTVSIY